MLRNLRHGREYRFDDPDLMDLEDRTYAEYDKLESKGLRCAHCGTALRAHDAWLRTCDYDEGVKMYCGHYCFHMAKDLGA